MSLRRRLEDNLFGPFDANEVLDEYVTHRKNAPLDLHRLEVVRNRRPSGLDESEASISTTTGKFRYFGALHVEDINRISPNGRRLIHEDMKRRGLNLTLDSIYGPDRPDGGLTVKIGLTFTAVHEEHGSQYRGLTYLMDKKEPDEMFLFSLTANMCTRKLRIVSLSPTCWTRSQNFITTYRFCRLLLDICSGAPKPTPEDFFNAYIGHKLEAGMPICKDTIVALMLKHATWLAKWAKQYVNVQSWKAFASTGILDLDERLDVEMYEIERDLCRLVGQSIPDSQAALTLSPRYERSRSVDSQSSLEYASDGQPFGRESERESSPERSPSPPFANPYVTMRVPIAFQYTPRVPDNFHWWCDVEGCNYNIYLLNLTRENLAMLDGETEAKLRLQDWSLSDPWIQLAFKAMVEDHRMKHLDSWGLRCLRGPSGVLERIELAEPPGPDKEKDKFSDLKIEFVNLL